MYSLLLHFAIIYTIFNALIIWYSEKGYYLKQNKYFKEKGIFVIKSENFSSIVSSYYFINRFGSFFLNLENCTLFDISAIIASISIKNGIWGFPGT